MGHYRISIRGVVQFRRYQIIEFFFSDVTKRRVTKVVGERGRLYDIRRQATPRFHFFRESLPGVLPLIGGQLARL